MPNRILKESICSSETLAQLNDFEENFFYKIIVNCDDYGRFDARPAMLKSRCYPLRERLTLTTITDALQKLASVGCVKLYSVDGRPYLHLPTWEVHQQVRAKKSKYPAPDSNGNQLISDDSICPRNPIQSESVSISESESYMADCSAESENEPKRKPRKKDAEELFERLWKLYPRKEGKGGVTDAQKLRLLEIGYDELSRAVERYVQSRQGQEAKYTKQGSTFFNSGYVDYLDENYSQKVKSAERVYTTDPSDLNGW